MAWKDPLPTSIGLITRSIGWGFGIAIIAAIAIGYGHFKLAGEVMPCLEQSSAQHQETALHKTQQLVACLDAHAGPLERYLLASSEQTIAALPNAPCAYLGTWTSTRGASVYKVVLTDNSQFIATPYQNTPPGSETVSGSWGIVGKRMVWLYDNGLVWPPDVNPITDASADAFTLIEQNGATTRYARIEPTRSADCRP